MKMTLSYEKVSLRKDRTTSGNEKDPSNGQKWSLPMDINRYGQD